MYTPPGPRRIGVAVRPHRPAALSRPGPLSKSTGVRWCRCRSRPPDAPLRMRVGGRLADHVADFESNARRERSNEMMSCQSACGAHAQMGRPVRVQLAGAFAHAPLTWRHAILTRLGSGERRCATCGRLRTPSMCLRVVRAGPFGCAFTSRCGSLWGARATRADQQRVSVHARESYIVCARCTNEFRVRPTGHCHP